MTVTITHLCKDSSAMVMAKNSMMVDLEVELVYPIFYQHLAELFSFPMGRYVSHYQLMFWLFRIIRITAFKSWLNLIMMERVQKQGRSVVLYY